MQTVNTAKNPPVVTYCEKRYGKILYRITSVHKGHLDLGKALEELTVRKILRQQNMPQPAENAGL